MLHIFGKPISDKDSMSMEADVWSGIMQRQSANMETKKSFQFCSFSEMKMKDSVSFFLIYMA